MRIILLSGKAGVGKDTFAKRIKEVEEAKGNKVFIMGFADILKSISQRNFNYTGNKEGIGRTILQDVGDLFINNNPLFFIEVVNLVIENAKELGYDYFVITDARYDKEVSATKGIYCKDVVLLQRTLYNTLTYKQTTHRSEHGISPSLLDTVINLDNNSVKLYVTDNDNTTDISLKRLRYEEYLKDYFIEAEEKSNE